MFRIPEKEHKDRVEEVREKLGDGFDALVLWDPTSISYLTGYHMIPTERPVALTVLADDDPFFFVPRLEEDHVRLRVPWVEDAASYFEYPSPTHPMEKFAEALRERGLEGAKLLADAPGYGGRWGYTGPDLGDVSGCEVEVDSHMVDDMRLVKSDNEVRLLEESGRWTVLAHRYLQELTYPGASESEIAMEASTRASQAMIRAVGSRDVAWHSLPPATAGFRGQVGEWSYYPHMLSNNVDVGVGDVLVTGATAEVYGYGAELERTFIVGEPSEKQERLFEAMVKAQRAALNAFGPGVKCSEVNEASFGVLREEGVEHLAQHRVGHGIGLEGHEPPWVAEGYETTMEPGMVFSCEPGVYAEGIGGFRHSDTVVVEEDGARVITPYPRDLESMTIEA